MGRLRAWRARRESAGKHVWLLDDVTTTGATLHAAANALRALPGDRRPKSISAAVLCVTDQRRLRSRRAAKRNPRRKRDRRATASASRTGLRLDNPPCSCYLIVVICNYWTLQVLVPTASPDVPANSSTPYPP